jgi:hypothetical protein
VSSSRSAIFIERSSLVLSLSKDELVVRQAHHARLFPPK